MTTAGDVAAAVLQELTALPPAAELARAALRLAIAALLGAAIGYERERRHHPAGLRTHMLIAVAAALFVLVPIRLGVGADGISRVIQGVVAGAGFLGIGAVLKLGGESEVRGLTTAAGLWLTAAAGLAAGVGQSVLAVLGVVLGVAILAAVKRVERWIGPRRGNGATFRDR